MKKTLLVLCAMALAFLLLTGCASPTIESANGGNLSVEGSTRIALDGGSITVTGGGAQASGSVVTISAAGQYIVSGRLDNGQLVVDTGEDKGVVTLVLDGADITNLTDAALFVRQAKDVVISLPAGTVSSLTSGTEADLQRFDDTATGGAIYAEDDVSFSGEGELNIFGYINSGVICKDDIDIDSGTLNVVAANNGVKGSESVELKGGVLNVNAGSDGVKATSAEKAGKGFVTVSGGTLAVCAAGDGVAAETELTISGGSVNVTTTGDPALRSCKALKAKSCVTITGGEIAVSSVDHAVHCTGTIAVSGGTVSLAGAAKGFAAHGDIAITGGKTDINVEDDGIETIADIYVGDGTVAVVSGGDGIRAGEANSTVGAITLDGGTLRISAVKDPIDAKSKLTVNGGTVIAAGTSKKLPVLAADSAQTCLLVSQVFPSGSRIAFLQNGAELAFTDAILSCNTLLYSSPSLVSGSPCTVTNGVTVTELVP